MYELDSSRASWHGANNERLRLNAADGMCPHCHTPSSFRAEFRAEVSGERYIQQSDGQCVRCSGKVSLFTVNPPKRGENRRCDSIWMFPVPKGLRDFKFTESHNLPRNLFESYEEAVNCHRYQRWRATVTECGRALEIISKDQFPTKEERRKLKDIGESFGKAISEEIPEILFKPIISLNQAIRLGRQSGAHFDITKPADREVATEVLDMLEYVIEYFYLLPDRVEQLKKDLKEEH